VGEKVEEQAAGYGEAEPGFCAGGGLVRSCLDQCVGQGGDPRLNACLGEPFGAWSADQGVGVQLEELPFGRPPLRIGEDRADPAQQHRAKTLIASREKPCATATIRPR
jgi:hypothetical protein